MSKDTLTKKQRRYRVLKDAGLCVDCGKEAATAGILCAGCRERYNVQAHKSFTNRTAARKTAELCLRCGSPDKVTTAHCEQCRLEVNRNNKRQDTQRRQQYRKEGLCISCGAVRDTDVLHCSTCRKRQRRATKKRNREIRQEVLTHYGDCCACCGETAIEFLQIDHVNNDGAEHRRQDPAAAKIYRWLKRHGFPKEGFQILCANCNWAKARYGYCPHDTEVENDKVEQRRALAPGNT